MIWVQLNKLFFKVFSMKVTKLKLEHQNAASNQLSTAFINWNHSHIL